MKKIYIFLISTLFLFAMMFGSVLFVRASAGVFGETDLDFATTDDGLFEEHSGGGWTVKNGKYCPVSQNSITKSTKTIDLSGTTYISFDFYITTPMFRFVLFGADANFADAWNSGGLGFIIMADAVRLYKGIDPGVWVGDCSTSPNSLMDGKVHNLKVKISDGKISYFVDGETVPLSFNSGAFSEVNISDTALSEQAIILFYTEDREAFIDNFKVSSRDISYTEPEQPESSYTELTVDFSSPVVSVFTNIESGWRTDSNRYYPATGSAKTYITQPIVAENDTYVSFDYYVGNTSQTTDFAVALLPDVESGAGLVLHQRFNNSQSVATLNSSLNVETNISEVNFGWDDGNVHNIKIKIYDKKVSYFLDGVLLDFGDGIGSEISFPFTDSEVRLLLSGSNTMTYIDNLIISANDIVYAPPVQDSAIDFGDVEVDLSTDPDAFTADSNGGWVISGNKLIPAADWAVSYFSDKISLTANKTITFTFNVSDAASDTQLNIGFKSVIGSSHNTGISLHFFNATDDLRLNYWFGNPWDSLLSTYSAKNFLDGNDHIIKMIVKDNTLSVKIDNQLIFKEFAINMQSGYLNLQSSLTSASISDFSIKNVAEPLNMPDASLDTSVPNIEIGDNVVQSTLKDNPLYRSQTYIIIAIVFGALAAVGMAVTVSLFILKKKKSN